MSDRTDTIIGILFAVLLAMLILQDCRCHVVINSTPTTQETPNEH